jgi:4-hydroxy-tetrahydrodipicolinate synthase
MGQMIRAALGNRWAEARELERRYAELIDANFWDSNPTPVKMVLSLMGRCSVHVRLPLVEPPQGTVGKLERVARGLGLLKPVAVPVDQVGVDQVGTR